MYYVCADMGMHIFIPKIFLTFLVLVWPLFMIYVYPYVFLKNLRLKAITKGIKFLLGHIKESGPLILIMVLSGLGGKIGSDWIHSHFGGNEVMMVGSAYIQNCVLYFLNILVFNVACMMLAREQDDALMNVTPPASS